MEERHTLPLKLYLDSNIHPLGLKRVDSLSLVSVFAGWIR